jgi:hypothetical protein
LEKKHELCSPSEGGKKWWTAAAVASPCRKGVRKTLANLPLMLLACFLKLKTTKLTNYEDI